MRACMYAPRLTMASRGSIVFPAPDVPQTVMVPPPTCRYDTVSVCPRENPCSGVRHYIPEVRLKPPLIPLGWQPNSDIFCWSLFLGVHTLHPLFTMMDMSSSSHDLETISSLSLSSSATTDFNSLPTELRLKIWSRASEPRIVLYGDLVQKSRSYPLPTVTQLTAEARDETRVGYEPIGNGSYFDFSRDILLCDHRISDQVTDQYLDGLAPRIRRLVFWDCFPDDGRVEGPYHYSVYLSACYRQPDFGKIEFDRFWFPNVDDMWIVKVGEIDPAWMVQVNPELPYRRRLQQLAKQFRYWVDENIIEMAPLDLSEPEAQAVLKDGRCGKEDCHELNRQRSIMLSKVAFLDGRYRAPDDGQKWIRIISWQAGEEKVVYENRMRWVVVERILTFDLQRDGWSESGVEVRRRSIQGN